MQKKEYSVATILSNLKIDSLNEMQVQALDVLEHQEELILLSATGSGKTLAFLIPVLKDIDTETKDTKAMIIVPSRELALQIEQVFRSMKTGLKVTCCYGGHLRETEENNLKQPPDLACRNTQAGWLIIFAGKI